MAPLKMTGMQMAEYHPQPAITYFFDQNRFYV